MPWSTDSDLLLHDASVSGLLSEPGLSSRQRAVAEDGIIQDLGGWYRAEAQARGVDGRVTPLTPSRLDAVQMKRMSVFATLAQIFRSQSKAGKEPDGLERKAETYARMYKDALKALLTAGVSYDWDGSGSVVETEIARPQQWRLRA